MPKIKTKEVAKETVKTLNKGIIVTQKTKKKLTHIKEKSETTTNTNEENANEYAMNQINNASKSFLNTSNNVRQKGNESVRKTKSNFIKAREKVKTIKMKRAEKKKIRNTTIKGIKKDNKPFKGDSQKVIHESNKVSKGAFKLAKERAERTYQNLKFTVKTTKKTLKAITMATNALLYFLVAVGWIALLVIIVICLIGLLLSSIFGIFFSGEKSDPTVMNMSDAIIECNKDFYKKLEEIQRANPHDEYVLEGNVALWKDMLIIYTVKQTNGIDAQEVVTMNNQKKQILKDIFWDMNTITSEVKVETVLEQGINLDSLPKKVEKRVLHVKIVSKTAEEMKKIYLFNPSQIKQYNELSSDEYSSLWNSVIYGFEPGEYIKWRQKDAPWSTVRIGNTNSTINDIGCLVTSIAILIQKSGISIYNINQFNPGTFVEALNMNDGFDEKGNLRYSAIKKVISNFEYVGNVDLREKTRDEKLKLIKEYSDKGYYLTVEVKGATEGNQHWVAIISVENDNITMVDPATDHMDMWSAYESSKTSQFNYFKVN